MFTFFSSTRKGHGRAFGLGLVTALLAYPATYAQDATPPPLNIPIEQDADTSPEPSTPRTETPNKEESTSNATQPAQAEPDAKQVVPFSPIAGTTSAARTDTDLTVSQCLLHENHTDRSIRRHYTLSVQRDTVAKKQYDRYVLPDTLQIKIDATLAFDKDPFEPDTVYIQLHAIRSSSKNPALPIAQLLPYEHQTLACHVDQERTYCTAKGSDQEILWPDWAPLTIDNWLTDKPVRAGTRWRRAIRSPQILGWINRYPEAFQSTLEVAQSGEQTTDIQGTFDTNGEVMVVGQMYRFPVHGTMRILFDHASELVQEAWVDWAHEFSINGMTHTQSFNLTQKTRVQVRVSSSIP